MTTLLSFVGSFCNEMGIAVPPAVVTSTDPQITQILAILQRLGRDISRMSNWQRLNKLGTITTTTSTATGNITTYSAVVSGLASTTGLSTAWACTGDGIAPFALIDSVDSLTQVTLNLPCSATTTGAALTFAKVEYPLPSDWLKQIPQTEWDRTNRWPLMGPISPQEWQSFQSGVVYSGPRLRFRIMANTMYVDPPPTAHDTLAYEYISQNWVLSTLGVGKAAFTADTDTFIFDDSLLMEGLILRWNKRKGFAYDEKDFDRILSMAMGQDRSAPKLSLAPINGSILITNRNVPETGFGP